MAHWQGNKAGNKAGKAGNKAGKAGNKAGKAGKAGNKAGKAGKATRCESSASPFFWSLCGFVVSGATYLAPDTKPA